MNTYTGIKERSWAKAKEEQITKLGLDVHAGQITVCRQQEGLLAQPAQKMSWERCLEWIQKQVSSGWKVYSCYEAGPCGYGLHRQLTALGVTNYVVAPQRWDERGRQVKTDKHDARELADRLDRYVCVGTRRLSRWFACRRRRRSSSAAWFDSAARCSRNVVAVCCGDTA